MEDISNRSVVFENLGERVVIYKGWEMIKTSTKDSPLL
jgi:hypothetical protein